MFTALFLLVGFFSCENETVDFSIDNEEQLISIIEVFTLGNSQDGSTTNYTINEGLNTQIEYEGNAYQIQTFTDEKMTMIEYFNDGAPTGIRTYTYDLNDRIISDSSTSFLTNQNINRTYEYVGNQILVTRTYLDNDGTITDEDSFIFTLNSSNQISKLENIDSDYSWQATYSNGNLSTFTTFNGTDVKASAVFSYTTELASIPYQKERYRFGAEWRNNIMLVQTGEYAFKQLAELGDNYLINYTYTLSSDPSMIITLTANYEFGNLGRLMNQTKDKMFFQSAHNRVLTYQYE